MQWRSECAFQRFDELCFFLRLPLYAHSLTDRDILRANLNPVQSQVANLLLARKLLRFFVAGDVSFGKLKPNFHHFCRPDNFGGDESFVKTPTGLNFNFADKLTVDKDANSVAPNRRTVPSQEQISGRARLLPSQFFGKS
jgi:hypothetical protein